MAKFKHEPTNWGRVGKGLLKVIGTLLFWVGLAALAIWLISKALA